MFYLAACIVLTSYLTLAFKVLGKYNINSFQAIVFNYITCVITGSFMLGTFPVKRETMALPWFGYALLMGSMFILLFNIISYSARHIGVAVTSVANKLSLVIPFTFSIYFYNETAGLLKYAGILTAVIAVILTCYPADKQQNSKNGVSPLSRIMIPLILFAGSGLLDTLIKYVEQAFLSPADQDAYLVTTFAAAASIGLIILLIRLATGTIRFSMRALLAGIAIGIPNYFSIWFLLHVLKLFPADSSVIIPVNNMGIVLFSTIVAWILFKEKLMLINWIGIILSIGAIALIAFG